MTEVNIASKVVFADDYARQQHYVLYPENSSSNAPLQTIEGSVGMGSKSFHAGLPEGATEVTVTVLTGGPLEFGLSSDGINFISETVTLNAPDSQTFPLELPIPPGVGILVVNQNGLASGTYKIEIF